MNKNKSKSNKRKTEELHQESNKRPRIKETESDFPSMKVSSSLLYDEPNEELLEIKVEQLEKSNKVANEWLNPDDAEKPLADERLIADSIEEVEDDISDLNLSEISDLNPSTTSDFDEKYKAEYELDGLLEIINNRKFGKWSDDMLEDALTAEEMKNLKDQNVRLSSLCRILNVKWLDDEAINGFVNLIFEQMHFANSYSKKRSLVLPTYFYNLFQSSLVTGKVMGTFEYLTEIIEKRGDRVILKYIHKKNLIGKTPEEKELIKKPKKLVSFEGIQRIGMPVNVGENHWVVLCVQMNEKNIYVLDSWRNTIEIVEATFKEKGVTFEKQIGLELNALIEYFIKKEQDGLLQEYHNNHTIRSRDWQVLEMECPQQEGTNECGLGACMNMLFLNCYKGHEGNDNVDVETALNYDVFDLYEMKTLVFSSLVSKRIDASYMDLMLSET